MKLDKSKIKFGIENFRQAVKTLTPSETIAIDIETTGLDYFSSKITWLSWCSSEIEFGVVPIRHRNFIGHKYTNTPENELIELIQHIYKSDIYTVYHNAKFDLGMFLAKRWLQIDDINPQKLHDTMLLSYLFHPVKSREEVRPHTLKNLYNELLRNHAEDEEQVEYNEVANGVDFEDADFLDAAYYAAHDAWSTFHLFKKFREKLNEKNTVSNYYKNIETPHILTTIEIIQTGLQLAREDEYKVINESMAKEEQKRPISTLRTKQVEMDTVKQQIFTLARRTFNFSSPDEIRLSLFNQLTGIKPSEKGKKQHKYLVDKNTLIKLFEKCDDLYRRTLISITLYAKFLDTTIKKQQEMYSAINRKTGRIHANIRATTASGRYSSPSPNILGLSRISGIRKHITPGKNKAFVVADFSQIDLRVIANETGEVNANSKMLKDINTGVDLHFNTLGIVDEDAAEKLKQNWNKISKDGTKVTLLSKQTIEITDPNEILLAKDLKRKRDDVAKKINFGVSYGLGPKGLMDALNKHDKSLDKVTTHPTQYDDEPAWITSLVKQGNMWDHKQHKWIEKASEALGLHNEIKDWIQEVKDALNHQPTDLETVKTYLEKFKITYPDIKEFQSKVENDLQLSGETYNMFGRLCRAEIIPHIIQAGKQRDKDIALDILIKKQWYRIFFETLHIDKKSLCAVIKSVYRLEMKKSRRSNVKEIDLEVEHSQLIFSLNTKTFENFKPQLQTLSDDDIQLELHRLFIDADFDASDFFEHLKPAAIISNGKVINISSFPYCHIPHSIIRRVVFYNRRQGQKELKESRTIRYLGYEKLRRNLISSRVSSTSMDIAKIAMLQFREQSKIEWPSYETRPKIVNCVHDEIVVECEAVDKAKVQQLLERCMTYDPNDNDSHFKKYICSGRKFLTKVECEAKNSELNYAEAKP